MLNDITDTTGAVFSSCSTPPGYMDTLINGCKTYTPIGPVTDTVRTCIVTCNNGKCDTSIVVIVPPVTPDTLLLIPFCDTCPVNGCVALNDVKDTVGATYSACGVPAGYTVTTSNGCSVYKSTGPIADTTQTCIVICNHGICDTTYVLLTPPKTPPPPPTSDTIFVKGVCDTCSVTACVVVDDIDPNGATYSNCGIPNGYTLIAFDSGCNTYKPVTQLTDTAETCIVICKNNQCDTTYVFLIPPHLPSDTIFVTPACDTCGVTACPPNSNSGGIPSPIYTSCGAPTEYTLTGPDTLGCYKFQPVAPLDSFRDQTCIVVCRGGVCDTTIVVIQPPTVTLPIGIVSFTGSALENKSNELRWTAVDELNMLNYTILRSTDQQRWQAIGTIAAKNSSGKQSFVMIDNNPGNENYYKLSYKDKFGVTGLYPKVVYLHSKGIIADKVSVYPNPANTRLTFEYNSIDHPSKVHVLITDIAGRIVREFDNDLISGKNILQLDISDLTNGSYLINYRNTSNGNNGTVKFVKRKE